MAKVDPPQCPSTPWVPGVEVPCPHGKSFQSPKFGRNGSEMTLISSFESPKFGRNDSEMVTKWMVISEFGMSFGRVALPLCHVWYLSEIIQEPQMSGPVSASCSPGSSTGSWCLYFLFLGNHCHLLSHSPELLPGLCHCRAPPCCISVHAMRRQIQMRLFQRELMWVHRAASGSGAGLMGGRQGGSMAGGMGAPGSNSGWIAPTGKRIWAGPPEVAPALKLPTPPFPLLPFTRPPLP